MKTIKANLNLPIYAERTSRTVPFLGRDKSEQEESQKILANSTVAIAGCGGIGGAMAVRLARLGVGHIKIADPGDFDISNINRQLGATIGNNGRNKAEVVGELINELSKDTIVDVYNEGITLENVDNFVSGADIILDKVDFSIIKEKFALHRAFRKSEKTKCILACSVIGWSAHLYKFEKNSMPIEEWYDFQYDENIEHLSTDQRTASLLRKWAPRFPHFPTFDTIMDSIKETDSLPIFAGAPPLAEGFLSQRTVLCLLDKEHPPYAETLPPIPYMHIYDAATLSGGIYKSDGYLKNTESVNQSWEIHDGRNHT